MFYRLIILTKTNPDEETATKITMSDTGGDAVSVLAEKVTLRREKLETLGNYTIANERLANKKLAALLEKNFSIVSFVK